MHDIQEVVGSNPTSLTNHKNVWVDAITKPPQTAYITSDGIMTIQDIPLTLTDKISAFNLELLAIYQALRAFPFWDLTIFSDSTSAVSAVTRRNHKLSPTAKSIVDHICRLCEGRDVLLLVIEGKNNPADRLLRQNTACHSPLESLT